MAADASKLADELDATRKQNRALSSLVSDLERQLADANQAKGSLADEDILHMLMVRCTEPRLAFLQPIELMAFKSLD